jgi:hypothetical protein
MSTIEPRARSFNITMCDDPHCQAVHIQLCDADGLVFAGMTVAVNHVDGFVDAVKHTADRVRHKFPPPERPQ